MNYSFIRYLESKKTVDDRALNSAVWEALRAELPQRPLEILEVGSGIGTMITRLAGWGLPDGSRYTAVDADPSNTQAAEQRLADWAMPLSVTLKTADVFDYLADSAERGKYDLVIAHAFLDLFDLPTILPVLFSSLADGGLFYFTLNFDGETVFEPTLGPLLDDLIVRLYHRTMDDRQVNGRPSGDSHSGRHLFAAIPAAGGEIITAGGSDWVVHPREETYLGDEAYFLHHILHFVETSLDGDSDLDSVQLRRWLTLRHEQVEKGELVYIAHQLDIAGRVS